MRFAIGPAPTRAQIEYIEILGYELDTRYIMTQGEASDIISHLLETSGPTEESEKMVVKCKYSKTVRKIALGRVQEAIAEKMAEKWFKISEIRVISKIILEKLLEEYPDAKVNLNDIVSVCMGWQEKKSKLKPLSREELSKKWNDNFFCMLVELNLAPPMCPKCGKATSLVQNKNTKQPFWGCSIYPKCGGGLPIDKALVNKFTEQSDHRTAQ